jgi:hypothetical protein
MCNYLNISAVRNFRCEKILGHFFTVGRRLALKVVYACHWGILTKTTEGQNNLIQIKQINIKCIKSLSFIICNFLIIFSQV